MSHGVGVDTRSLLAAADVPEEAAFDGAAAPFMPHNRGRLAAKNISLIEGQTEIVVDEDGVAYRIPKPPMPQGSQHKQFFTANKIAGLVAGAYSGWCYYHMSRYGTNQNKHPNGLLAWAKLHWRVFAFDSALINAGLYALSAASLVDFFITLKRANGQVYSATDEVPLTSNQRLVNTLLGYTDYINQCLHGVNQYIRRVCKAVLILGILWALFAGAAPLWEATEAAIPTAGKLQGALMCVLRMAITARALIAFPEKVSRLKQKILDEYRHGSKKIAVAKGILISLNIALGFAYAFTQHASISKGVGNLISGVKGLPALAQGLLVELFGALINWPFNAYWINEGTQTILKIFGVGQNDIDSKDPATKKLSRSDRIAAFVILLLALFSGAPAISPLLAGDSAQTGAAKTVSEWERNAEQVFGAIAMVAGTLMNAGSLYINYLDLKGFCQRLFPSHPGPLAPDHESPPITPVKPPQAPPAARTDSSVPVTPADATPRDTTVGSGAMQPPRTPQANVEAKQMKFASVLGLVLPSLDSVAGTVSCVVAA